MLAATIWISLSGPDATQYTSTVLLCSHFRTLYRKIKQILLDFDLALRKHEALQHVRIIGAIVLCQYILRDSLAVEGIKLLASLA